MLQQRESFKGLLLNSYILSTCDTLLTIYLPGESHHIGAVMKVWCYNIQFLVSATQSKILTEGLYQYTILYLFVTVIHNAQHSKKNWSAQPGNLLVHSKLLSLVHQLEMHFFPQGCAQKCISKQSTRLVTCEYTSKFPS